MGNRHRKDSVAPCFRELAPLLLLSGFVSGIDNLD